MEHHTPLLQSQWAEVSQAVVVPPVWWVGGGRTAYRRPIQKARAGGDSEEDRSDGEDDQREVAEDVHGGSPFMAGIGSPCRVR